MWTKNEDQGQDVGAEEDTKEVAVEAEDLERVAVEAEVEAMVEAADVEEVEAVDVVGVGAERARVASTMARDSKKDSGVEAFSAS